MQQVRYPYCGLGVPRRRSTSTAYNLDAALAARRSCYEGNETWLNQFERGRDYAAGDLWGCVGLWFSGRWYTPGVESYIADGAGLPGAADLDEAQPFIDFQG